MVIKGYTNKIELNWIDYISYIVRDPILDKRFDDEDEDISCILKY